MKKFFSEFREFINQGSAVELAVGVVIGAAFTAIVTSIVNDLLMPIISLCTGGIDFTEMKIVLGEEANSAAFCYGNFISVVIQFILIALIVFLLIKAIAKFKKITHLDKKDKPKTKTCPHCLEEVKIGATRCPHCTGIIKKTTSEKQ